MTKLLYLFLSVIIAVATSCRSDDPYDALFTQQLLTHDSNSEYCFNAAIVGRYHSADSSNWILEKYEAGTLNSGSEPSCPKIIWFKNGKLRYSVFHFGRHLDPFIICWMWYNKVYNFRLFVETDINSYNNGIISPDGHHLFQHMNHSNGSYTFMHSTQNIRCRRNKEDDLLYFKTTCQLIPAEIPTESNSTIKVFDSYDEACLFVLNALKERPDLYEIYIPPLKTIDDVYENFRDTSLDFDLL